MTISVDWSTQVITIEKVDTTLVSVGPPEIRSLDTEVFRLALKALEYGEEGIVFDDTHQRNPPVTVGGVSLAQVIEIINGYTVTFEESIPAYAVNLTGSNNNIGDVLNLNTTQIRSTNSAGLTFSNEILDQSYISGLVALETASAFSGTSFPIGTLKSPVNNWADAEVIRSDRGLLGFRLRGLITLTSGEDAGESTWEGHHGRGDRVTFSGGGNASGRFTDVGIAGVLSGRIFAERCHMSDGITGFQGSLIECGITGTLTWDSAATLTILLEGCHSHEAGGVTLDFNGAPANVSIRGWHGPLTLTNITAGTVVCCDLDSAKVTLDSSCTTGTIVIRGLVDLVDNSAGSTVLTDSMYLLKNLAEADQAFDKSGGLLHTYKRGTTTDLIPAKTVAGEAQTIDASITE